MKQKRELFVLEKSGLTKIKMSVFFQLWSSLRFQEFVLEDKK